MTRLDATRRLFKPVLRSIAERDRSHAVDEAALPAYAHANPLIDLLFWGRLRVAFDEVARVPGARVLDFGCGSGVMSHALASEGHEVVALDVDLAPLALVRREIEFPPGIDFVQGNLLERTPAFPDASFDVILALDVLEHVEDVEAHARAFRRLLRPNGAVVVSGPTESRLYALGRRIAGSRFTGHYHVTDVHAIRRDFDRHFETTVVRRLYWPVVLFEVFRAEEPGA